MHKLLGLPLLAFALCTSGNGYMDSPVISLHELAAHPNKYANKVVRVQAIYFTDMVENGLLFDSRGRLMPIDIMDERKIGDQASRDKLDDAMFEARDAGRPVIFSVNFSAIFRVKPEQGESPFEKGHKGRLHILRVWSFSWLPEIPKSH